MTRAIGGFHQLDLPRGRGSTWHPRASARLATGRACLQVIVSRIRPRRIWVPYYICDSALAGLAGRGIEVSFYPIDEQLEPTLLPPRSRFDLFLYVNYFDLKKACVQRLARRYGDRLVIDNTQAFFSVPPAAAWAFNSARKFFGVPDGAFLYGRPVNPKVPGSAPWLSLDHLLWRLEGDLPRAYAAFRKYEESITAAPYAMSAVSRGLLASLPAAAARRVRQANARYLHDRLGPSNALRVDLPRGAAPLFYPYLPARAISRRRLADQRVFVPVLWRECIDRAEAGYAWERHLARRLLPLPVDHRYAPADLDRVVQLVRP